MQELLIQYANREEIKKDAALSFEKQIEKVKKAYEKGEIDTFGAIVCITFASLLCFFLSIIYQIKYLVAKVIYAPKKPHVWTESERKRMEVLGDIENTNLSSKAIYDKETPSALSKGECASFLRKELLKTKFLLKGTVLRTTFPKVTGEELLQASITGSLDKPFIIQRVSFGNDINKALKILYPNLKNRRVKGQQDTYMVFEGDEIFTLEQKLRETFMCPVTINLRAE